MNHAIESLLRPIQSGEKLVCKWTSK